MFTGLISDVGVVASLSGAKAVIHSNYDPATIDIGASIACDGCCLTVTELDQTDTGAAFSVEISNETFECTILGKWHEGSRVNLERSLTIGAELGGHLVTGHVDGVASITNIEDDGISKRFTFDAPNELAKFIAPKGSIALNGTSLTVNEVDGSRFGVNLIPHTLEVTNWGQKSVGDLVNLEVDLMARYAARLSEFGG